MKRPNQICLVLLAAVAGWLAGGWIWPPDVEKDADRAASTPESILGDRRAGNGLFSPGAMSRRIVRTARWAENVSLGNEKWLLRNVALLPTETLREVARFVLSERFLRDDPVTALALANALSLDAEAIRPLVTELSLETLEACLRRAPWNEKLIFEALAEADPDKAFQLVESAGLLTRSPIFAIIGAFAKRDIRQAAAAAVEFPHAAYRPTAVGHVVDLWVSEDMEAALEWLEQLPDADLRAQKKITWATAAAREDPERALALADRLGSSRTKALLYSAAVSALVVTNPEKAFAQLAKAPLPDYSKVLQIRSLARSAAGSEPRRFLDALDSFARNQGYVGAPLFEERRLAANRRIYENWARRDLEAAQAHAEAIEDAHLREDALKAISSAQKSSTP